MESNRNKMAKLGEILTIKKKLGEGTYGAVYEAHSNTGKCWAVKENFLYPSTDFTGSVREMDFLIRLKGHPNIVRLESLSLRCPFTNPIQNKDPDVKPDKLYFVMEYVSTNLRGFINGQGYNPALIRKYMADILLGVEFMHSRGIVHRDIKPSNILWTQPSSKDPYGYLKICDFGMCRNVCKQGCMTPRVVSCWYRAPEICYDQDYDEKSDLWSIGLVFYEMITRKALLEGFDDDNSRIIQAIISKLSKPLDKILNLPRQHTIKMRKDYPILLDLLGKLLMIDPKQRITASQALNHPYFDEYKNYITSVRTAFPPVETYNPVVQICPGQWRDLGMQIAFSLFNQRKTFPWYRHHTLFTAIALFDKYIIWLQQSKQYLNWLDIELRFMVCWYVAIKYSLTMDAPPSFVDLVASHFAHERLLEVAELAEEELIERVLGFIVHTPTIYNVADRAGHKLDETTIRDLLVYYGGVPHQQRQPGEMYATNLQDLYQHFVQARSR